jgi:oligoendopeptidase F
MEIIIAEGGYPVKEVTPMAKKKSGIKIKKYNQGKLRKSTKTKKGQKIPKSKLKKLTNSKNPKTRKRAQFALNASKWKKGGKKS